MLSCANCSGGWGDLDGDTRIMMEATGNYHLPVAIFLYDSGFYVSVVNAMLVHGYGSGGQRRTRRLRSGWPTMASTTGWRYQDIPRRMKCGSC